MGVKDAKKKLEVPGAWEAVAGRVCGRFRRLQGRVERRGAGWYLPDRNVGEDLFVGELDEAVGEMEVMLRGVRKLRRLINERPGNAGSDQGRDEDDEGDGVGVRAPEVGEDALGDGAAMGGVLGGGSGVCAV